MIQIRDMLDFTNACNGTGQMRITGEQDRVCVSASIDGNRIGSQ